MNILVTGGAGYKGVMLVEQLLDLGHKVTLLDNFMYGYAPVLHVIHRENLKIHQLDIRNLSQSDVSAYDVVYHLAGISGVPACSANPHSAEVINVVATQRLVELLGKSQLLINASTTSFYGASGKAFDETMPVEPVSIYGLTKYKAEQIVQARVESISLRFATVYGLSPKMRDDLLVNDFVHKAITDKLIILFSGNSKRTFVHIRDAVAAYVFCLHHISEMRGQVYNVGSEKLNFSKREIVNQISQYVKFETVDSTYTSEDKRNFEVCFTKLNSLGYTTRYTLDDGIKELVKLYRFYTPARVFNVI